MIQLLSFMQNWWFWPGLVVLVVVIVAASLLIYFLTKDHNSDCECELANQECSSSGCVCKAGYSGDTCELEGVLYTTNQNFELFSYNRVSDTSEDLFVEASRGLAATPDYVLYKSRFPEVLILRHGETPQQLVGINGLKPLSVGIAGGKIVVVSEKVSVFDADTLSLVRANAQIPEIKKMALALDGRYAAAITASGDIFSLSTDSGFLTGSIAVGELANRLVRDVVVSPVTGDVFATFVDNEGALRVARWEGLAWDVWKPEDSTWVDWSGTGTDREMKQVSFVCTDPVDPYIYVLSNEEWGSGKRGIYRRNILEGGWEEFFTPANIFISIAVGSHEVYFASDGDVYRANKRTRTPKLITGLGNSDNVSLFWAGRKPIPPPLEEARNAREPFVPFG